MVNEISTSEFLSLLKGAKQISKIRLPIRMKMPKLIEEVTFEQVDFNAPIFGGLLNRPVIRKSKFINSDLDGLNVEKSLFEDCIFDKVIFGHKYIGRIDKCKFYKCTFIECQFKSFIFKGNSYNDCSFDRCKLKRITFNDCDFENVTFSGEFATVNFVGCRTANTDVSKVKMKEVAMVDINYNGIKLPDNKDNFFAYAQFFESAKPELEKKLSPRTYEHYCSKAEYIMTYCSDGVMVDRDMFEEASKVEKDIIMETLYKIRE
ncbi:pentapeptide repeat-containing protein [Acetivibrio clariflavus]|uniref:Pentapeptide repeat-containing protein n=1 Tax=Acetivibrio clariflavus (strain DSM 19732 / NBRC 101661 / EBR45) TaxID=720554 RepID=G8M274_ACECE|nr:pentapeptide repeat-containing protein [Acetivibrio clariflavus]AEV69233.1 hypothetical protein Clocl_2667 [Acetivibrio clariflavus DSM 19732]